ncbi:MAG: inositol monophosphatase family protein [Candidatus Rifleibacteriota bacterium]
MDDLKSITNQAAEVAQMAGNLLAENQLKNHEVSHKGTVDLVTEMDLASEKLIREELTKRFPDIAFFGEEDGGTSWNQGLVWVVDPLDGTTNYANNLDHYCVSIALCSNGEPIIGVLYHPAKKHLYKTWKNGGAFRNDEVLKVNNVSELNSALAVTGFPYNRRQCMPEILKRLEIMLMNVQGVRRLGSAALDLCYVANGVFSIFWENNLKPWDIAAGSLLVEEAGGKISCFNGEKMKLDSFELLATNSLLHTQAVELLKSTSNL